MACHFASVCQFPCSARHYPGMTFMRMKKFLAGADQQMGTTNGRRGHGVDGIGVLATSLYSVIHRQIQASVAKSASLGAAVTIYSRQRTCLLMASL